MPLEATPALFAWLAKFEPMHQVFVGARALLYLGGRADAGLSQSLVLTAIGLVIGVLFGAIVTRIYDRRGEPQLRQWPQKPPRRATGHGTRQQCKPRRPNVIGLRAKPSLGCYGCCCVIP